MPGWTPILSPHEVGERCRGEAETERGNFQPFNLINSRQLWIVERAEPDGNSFPQKTRQALWQPRGRARHRPRGRRPRIHRAGRPVRLRQVDDAAHDRRAGGDLRRRDPHRRPGGQRPAAALAQHLHGVPVLRALSAYDGAREHGLLAEDRRPAARRDRAARRRSRGDPRPRTSCSSGGRRSCPAASASASPWAAPSCAIRDVFLFDEPLSNLDAKLRTPDAHRDQEAARQGAARR